ncbi:hypothetical protein SDC9_172421 [bioreactor metagenome]|uniref:Uncharacterized protein n=1 Tax=bioreactor metagenome TaxID=1076179 RepID=A0A645GM48_9ZZZZ
MDEVPCPVEGFASKLIRARPLHRDSADAEGRCGHAHRGLIRAFPALRRTDLLLQGCYDLPVLGVPLLQLLYLDAEVPNLTVLLADSLRNLLADSLLHHFFVFLLENRLDLVLMPLPDSIGYVLHLLPFEFQHEGSVKPLQALGEIIVTLQ